MIEDETSPEVHAKEPVLKWASGFANNIGTSYVLRDESIEGSPVVAAYIVDEKTKSIVLLMDDSNGELPQFQEHEYEAARKLVEEDYLKTLANSTSRDVSLGADDGQLVHQD